MISPSQARNLQAAFAAAKSAGHLFPAYAACEAALESEWFASKLCTEANNLFGQKQGHETAGFDTVSIPTMEYDKASGKWCPASAVWPKFPNWVSSFESRMALLRSMPMTYGKALAAQTGEDFVKLVSAHWSTDPARATKVLEIYNAHKDLLV